MCFGFVFQSYVCFFCLFVPFFLSFLTECGSCYLINMGSVIGIIASDIILTIFITISVFCFATHQRRGRQWESHNGERHICVYCCEPLRCFWWRRVKMGTNPTLLKLLTGKRSVPSSISKKMATEVTESPYQVTYRVFAK